MPFLKYGVDSQVCGWGHKKFFHSGCLEVLGMDQGPKWEQAGPVIVELAWAVVQ